MKKDDLWFLRSVGARERGLTVMLWAGVDPHLAIQRENADQVRVDLDQVSDLVEVLSQAAADLAAAQGEGAGQ